ncbi:MAG: hypothetical protein KDK91_23160 [Gammaproteobacteria bacterium]|nr:hypothetical protein [Gammaproteobacteria bacterium]
MRPLRSLIPAVALLACTFAGVQVGAETLITIARPASAPVLDGELGDWQSIAPIRIPLVNSKPDGRSDVAEIELRAAVHGERVYLALRWKDASHDAEHRPFVWDDAAGRYRGSDAYEDRIAIQFGMSGDYSADWLSGQAFTADMWHWKAHRSNSLGLVHDKRTIVSRNAIAKAYKATARDGGELYIARPSDEGTPLYSTLRHVEREADKMPRYQLAEKVSGSIADVRARGVWADGYWTVEIERALDTGHADDVRFVPGQRVAAGIAVFNATGNDDHNVSETLSFQF